jgi:hypothetical protein
MPLSDQQITSFTTKARAAGASDAQILQEIARKKQQVAEIDRANEAASSGILAPDKALEAGADIGVIKQAQQKTNQSAKQPILDAVNSLMQQDTGPITGAVQVSDGGLSVLNPANIIDALSGRKAQATKNTYDQVKAMLSLDNVGKLKGQGAISEGERALLSDAATKLGRNMSDTDFKATLAEIQKSLGGGSSNKTQGTSDNPADAFFK